MNFETIYDAKNINELKIYLGYCDTINCLNVSQYGHNYETKCSKHFENNMINFYPKKSRKICQHNNCIRFAKYNYNNIKQGRLCNNHKLNNMNSCYLKNKNNKNNEIYPKKYIRFKEKNVVSFIINEFPDYSWKYNKSITINENIFKPDLFTTINNKTIIIEINEEQHCSYDKNRERIRETQLLNYFDNCFFINFNPDGYKNNQKQCIQSCWKNGQIVNTKIWEKRLNILKLNILSWINENNYETKTIKLFYDNFKE